MTQVLTVTKINDRDFAPYGDVIEVSGAYDKLINQGMCERYHDRAKLDFIEDGQAGISLFNAKARQLPYIVDMVERHPLGSQAFIPMVQARIMIVVCDDDNNMPVNPRAFITTPQQGINLYRNVWHGVLAPLHQGGLFAVVDRIGDGNNLVEHFFDTPFVIESVPE